MSKNDEVMLSLKGCAILKVGIWAHRHYAPHERFRAQNLSAAVSFMSSSL